MGLRLPRRPGAHLVHAAADDDDRASGDEDADDADDDRHEGVHY